MKNIFKLFLICLLVTSCFNQKHKAQQNQDKLTFIFDFDATLYNFNKDSAYFDQIYYSIVNGDDARMQEYKIDTKEIAITHKEHDFVKELANKYYKNIAQKDVDFAVTKVNKNQTQGLDDIIKQLKKESHQVLIIGGSAFGCAIIPEFAKQFGIEKSDIYSGYFKDFSKISLQKAFTFDNFEYVNCENPDTHTVYSKKKSDLIKLLKNQNKIKGRVIHIGDGENDLEVWKAGEADLFIGFGVNRYSKKVEDGSEFYVKTMDEFRNEIDKILNQHNLIIYSGRFQPFHQGHHDMIKEAQKHGKHVLIAISQAKGMQKDERNVFSGDDREKMIRDTLEKDGFKNYSIIQLDYVGNNQKKYKNKEDGLKAWDNNLIKATKKIFKKDPAKADMAFIYYDRDKANYDKRFSKDFEIIEVKSSFDDDISATKIRKEFFNNGKIDEKLPSGTREFLRNYKDKCNKNEIQIAITFDDLPFAGRNVEINRTNYDSIKKILEIARKYNIPEMYGFVNGYKVKTKEDEKILQLWTKYYPIGNHAYSHMSLNESNLNDYKDDIIKNEEILKKFSNNKNYKYYRYPYLYEGNTLEKRNAIREFLKQNNYKIAEITVDFEDWAFSKSFTKCFNKNNNEAIKTIKSYYLQNAEKMLKRSVRLSDALFKRPIKHILLLHASDLNAEYFEDLIKLYQQNNVEFIPLSEAVKDEIYSINYDKSFKEGREFIYQLAIAKGFDLKSINANEKDYFNFEDLTKIDKMCD